MDDVELRRCQRFKEIRQVLGMKQGDFAKELAISQGHASDIENGRKTVSDRIIEILSLKYGVNEEWLRNGGNSGMFVSKSRSEEISEFAGKLLREDDESFKKRLIEALAKLNEDQWKVLERVAKELIKED